MSSLGGIISGDGPSYQIRQFKEKEKICNALLEIVEANLKPKDKDTDSDVIESRIEGSCIKHLKELGITGKDAQKQFLLQIIDIGKQVLNANRNFTSPDAISDGKSRIHDFCLKRFAEKPLSPLSVDRSLSNRSFSKTYASDDTVLWHTKIAGTPTSSPPSSATPLSESPTSTPPDSPRSRTSFSTSSESTSVTIHTLGRRRKEEREDLDMPEAGRFLDDEQELEYLNQRFEVLIKKQKPQLLSKRKKLSDNLKLKREMLSKAKGEHLKQRIQGEISQLEQDLSKVDNDLKLINIQINQVQNRKNDILLKPFNERSVYKKLNVSQLQSRLSEMHDEILVKKRELAESNREPERQNLDKEIQALTQKFVEIYAIYASKSFGLGKWYARDENLSHREKGHFEKIYNIAQFRNQFPDPASFQEIDADILALKGRNLEIAEYQKKQNEKINKGRLEKDQVLAAKKLIAEKDTEFAINIEQIHQLEQRKLNIKKEAIFNELESEVYDLMRTAYIEGMSDWQVNALIQTRFGAYGDDVVNIMKTIITNEKDAVKDHYRKLALLDIEYNLAIPGVYEPAHVPFDYDKWKLYTGNLKSRLQSDLLTKPVKDKLPTDALIDAFAPSKRVIIMGHRRDFQQNRLHKEEQLRSAEQELERAKVVLKEMNEKLPVLALSLVPPIEEIEQGKKVARLQKKVDAIKSDLLKLEKDYQQFAAEILEYPFVKIVSQIVGKNLTTDEIKQFVREQFPDPPFSERDLLEIVNFVKQEALQIENRHAEIDEHLSTYSKENLTLRPGFINSPTECRNAFKELSDCQKLGVFKNPHLIDARMGLRKQDQDLDLAALIQQLEDEGESPETLASRLNNLPIFVEYAAFSFNPHELVEKTAEAVVSPTQRSIADSEYIVKVHESFDGSSQASQNSSSAHTDTSQAGSTGSKSTTESSKPESSSLVPEEIGIAASTIKGLFAIWQVYHAGIKKKELKKDIEKAEERFIGMQAIVNEKIEGLKILKKSDIDHPVGLNESYTKFVNSFDLDAIKKRGIGQEDLDKLLKLYEHYKLVGDQVFCEFPSENPLAVNRGKEMLENLVRICSMSKNLYLLDCDLHMKKALYKGNRDAFIFQCLVNGPVALGSFFQNGIYSASLAAAFHTGGYDPVGIAKETLKLGGSIAGLVVGAGTMITGIKALSESYSKHQELAKKIKKIDEEIEKLNIEKQAHHKLHDQQKEKLCDTLIKIKKAQIVRIQNQDMLSKLRAAKGIVDASSGAANIASSGVAIAGAAALGVSTAGIALAVIAGTSAAVGLTMAANEYLKNEKFDPVLEQLKVVHAAQMKYYEHLQQKIREKGYDAIHADLHLHMHEELHELEEAISGLREKYDAYIDKEISQRLAKVWWIKDKNAEVARSAIKDIERLNIESPEDRQQLKDIIGRFEHDPQFKPGEDLQKRALQLVEGQILGDARQELMGSVGVFSSHQVRKHK